MLGLGAVAVLLLRVLRNLLVQVSYGGVAGFCGPLDTGGVAVPEPGEN